VEQVATFSIDVEILFHSVLVSVLPVLDVKAAVGAASSKLKIFGWFEVCSGIFKVVTVTFLDLQNHGQSMI
jgi:hypothetical protein